MGEPVKMRTGKRRSLLASVRRWPRRLLVRLLKPAVQEIMLNTHFCYGDPSRLSIAPGSVVKNALFNTLSGRITIGPDVFFGFGVSVLTGAHDYQKTGHERMFSIPTEGRDIVIGRGAWVASHAMILGPCTIGEDAVVAAGAVVTKDVEARTLVAGVPARLVKRFALDTTPAPDPEQCNRLTEPSPGHQMHRQGS